jgi:hypothetical protein
MTKSGQRFIVMPRIGDMMEMTANLGFHLFSRRSTRPPPSLLDEVASWIDGVKETQ